MKKILLLSVLALLLISPALISAGLGVNINLVEREISVGAPSSQWWTQLASSVAGGLAFATILTLWLTPSLLMIQANVLKRWHQRRG